MERSRKRRLPSLPSCWGTSAKLFSLRFSAVSPVKRSSFGRTVPVRFIPWRTTTLGQEDVSLDDAGWCALAYLALNRRPDGILDHAV